MNNDGWHFNGSATNESILRPLCQRAEQEISIPDHKLSRYFAATDSHSQFIRDMGKYCRGFHVPASAREHLPSDLQNKMAGSDHLIYIKHSTCLDPTSCVITYAHELQHAKQHGLYPKLLEINSVLRRYLDPVPASEMDLPTERDANIVSKGIGERVCGEDVVRSFAEEQIRLMEIDRAAAQKMGLEDDEICARQQKVKWELFLSTPSSTVYDPVPATLALVEKHGGAINWGMDVEKSEWWLGPWPEPLNG